MTALTLTGRSWVLSWDQKPMTENEHRTLHYRRRAEFDRQWRHTFCELAMVSRLPIDVPAVRVTVTHERPNRSAMPDVAAVAPSAKAAIDGLVDWGLVADDGPEQVVEITFRVAVTGRHALTLLIEEVAA